jgi:membrane dipeptidase
MLIASAVSLLILSAQSVSPRARELHERALVFDAHVHMVNRHLYDGGDMGQRQPNGQVDLPRLKEGGMDALFFSIFVSEEYYPGRHETRQAIRLMEEAHRQIERNRDKIAIAYTATDIERITRQGKMAAFLDLEGGFDLDGDLRILRALYRMGLRSAQLPAHNWANNFADSCCAGTRKAGGLNERGREVVREMNRLGMVINVAHGSEEMIAQAIDASSDPILSTHDGLRAVNNIPRLMTDGNLRKLAAKGGVMGIQIGNEFHNVPMFDYRTKQAGKPFWDRSDVEKQRAAMTMAELDALAAKHFPMVGIPAPDSLLYTVDQWFNVVDRVIALVGEDHVMLGTDLDGGPTLPRGVRDCRDLPLYTDAMLRRGYSEQRIRKFLGGNLLRVVRQVTER